MAHSQSTNIIRSAVVDGREKIKQRKVPIQPGEYYWVRDVLTERWEVGWVPRKEIEPVATKIITLIGLIKIYPSPKDGMGFQYQIGPRIDPPVFDGAGEWMDGIIRAGHQRKYGTPSNDKAGIE